MKNEIIYHGSWAKIMNLMFLGGLIAFVGISLYSSDNLFVQILGILNFIIGFIPLVAGFLALIRVMPKITLNELGIKDNRIVKEFVSWDEIENVDLIYEQRHNMLLIALKREKEYSNLTFLHRSLKSSKKNLDNKTLKIDLSFCEVNYSELLNFLREKNVS